MYKNSLRDFSNKNINNNHGMHSNDIIATAVDVVTTKANELVIETSLPFVTLLFAIIAVTYYRPQIYCAREFYKKCFDEVPWSWKGPPRKWIYDIIWFFMDALSTASLVQYLFTFASHAPDVAAQYYISVVSMYILYLVFRYFWINAFWNYHNKKTFVGEDVLYSSEVSVALFFAVVFVFLAWVVLIVLMVLFGKQGGVNAPAVWLLFFPTVWVTFIFIWTIMVWNCLPKYVPTKKSKQCAV